MNDFEFIKRLKKHHPTVARVIKSYLEDHFIIDKIFTVAEDDILQDTTILPLKTPYNKESLYIILKKEHVKIKLEIKNYLS